MKPNPAPLWRTLDEYREPPDWREQLDHELAWRADEHVDGMDRRDFARLMAAALAMAGLSGCTRQPIEKIVPYVREPAEITQGKPLYYATAMPFDGDAIGLVVKSHMGRPVKVEGNPRHPASLGATDIFAQASLFDLYDPDRSQTLVYQGRISSWVAFVSAMGAMLGEQMQTKGARLRLLTRSVNSPTLARQIEAFRARFPEARWHQWEPAVSGARLGGQMAFGQFVNTYYRVDMADVIVAVDSDFLACARYAHDFAARRGWRAGESGMNRLYAVESCPTSTGACADHRLPLRNRDLEPFLLAVAQGVASGQIPGVPPNWIPALVKDLQQHRGASLVVVGEGQPPRLHALAHAINAALGNTGNTVVYTDPIEHSPADPFHSLRELVAEMNAGAVDVLVMIGTNPVYDAPADLGFAAALAKVRNSVHMGLHYDETAERTRWHVPQTHYLEEWSDCRAFDGTASIVQPLIAPLYHGRSPHELMAVLTGQPDASPYELVRATWRHGEGQDFERSWRAWLHDGVVPNSALPPKTLQAAAQLPPAPPSGEGIEIRFRPDPTIWDGRFANNSYLQELPKPGTTLTWDAAAFVSPRTAERLALKDNDLVELDWRGRKTPFAVLVLPGHADEAFTVHLGYGRKRSGEASPHGFNAYAIRTSDAPWWGAGLQVAKTGGTYRLAVVQQGKTLMGRYPVRMGTLERYRHQPGFAHEEPFEKPTPPSLTVYPEWRYEGQKWGMAIDLNACVGCNACVVACDIENNIPVVGKDQVLRGREMHWLRIDQYRQGPPENPRTYFQPVPCMHCENAPCELVCPVNATVHSSDGLNQMVYNRCVGTRYCSNNCPYKVRVYNFFLYSDWYRESLSLMRNPDVTVRSRGVMEKCTYCVQRIQHAKIEAEREDRAVRDGEVQTACQQACPTQAIVFGDLNNKDSRVFKLKRQPLDYSLLDELNTRPRTTYLARVVNLNPEIDKELPHA